MRASLLTCFSQACAVRTRLAAAGEAHLGTALPVYRQQGSPCRSTRPALGTTTCYATASRAMSSAGKSTAIEHLFLAKVLAIISGQQTLGFGRASQLIVVFDSPPKGEGVPLRRSMYPAYKGNRSAPPDEVISALASLPTVLHAMGVNTLLVPGTLSGADQAALLLERLMPCHVSGVEADDVIATLATAFNQRQRNVTIFSSDKDFRQLLCEHTCLERLKELETEATFIAEHNFLPEFFIDFQALTGDSADNVTGVKGIGPKRAKNLISKHLTIENIYTAIPDMASNAVSKSLADADFAQVLQLRTLFQLQRHVRTKGGDDLLDMLPFGHSNLLAFDRADVDWVVNYMDRLQLSQDKSAFLALMEKGDKADA